MQMNKKRCFFIYIVLLFPLLLSAQGENYIWIGGTGNWSDTLHWYSESGGLPGETDNVVFNNGSFSEKNQVVTIDIAAVCRNMTWGISNMNPVLAGSATLEIGGSLTLTVDLTINYTGDIRFTGVGSDHILNTNGRTFKSNIEFDGLYAWNLSSILHTENKTITLTGGTLNLNGNSMSCGTFQSLSSGSRSLNCASSIITIHGNNGSWKVNNSLDLNASNSNLIFDNPNLVSQVTFEGGSLVYGTVAFMNDAIVKGSNTYSDFFLKAGHTYKLSGGETQTITGSFIARGCAGMIYLTSLNGAQAQIAKTNGNINVSFLKISSIKSLLSGSNEFNAYNSIDDGNNDGINIYTDQRDMYWINSTGYWSDTTHWTSSQGGEDADCVPVDYDNIFFNNASFDGTDSVKVDLKNLSCNNMTWAGSFTPVFMSIIPTPTLAIFGSLEFMETMNNKFIGPVFFADTLGGQTIKTGNRLFNKEITFIGDKGGWTIYDSLKVEGKIIYYFGDLNTNDNYVSCHGFCSDSAFIRKLSLGESKIDIQQSLSPNAWSLNNENLEFDGDESFIEVIASNSSFYNYGGDSLIFNNVLFTSIIGTARLNTMSDTYAKFHRVTFNSNGSIISSNTFDTLSFTPGNYYDLSPGSTQKINYEIFPTGICEGPILIKSSSNGVQANIYKLNDTIRVQNTAIRDIKAMGSAYFIAENSVDLGNNNGWDTLLVSAPGKLYWVGGAGEWNNKDHWSLTSGGPGGECIPTPYDTVIFDQNSFSAIEQYCNVNLNNVFAHDMNWTEAIYYPEFKSGINSAYLRIYGSLKLNPDMNFTFPAYISFESSDTGETIITENIKFHNLNNDVFFDGIGGEWTLQDSLSLGYALENRNKIYYMNGDLKTNDKFVDCFGFNSTLPSIRNFSPDSSDIHVNYDWVVNGTNLNLIENTARIEIDSGYFSHYNGNYFPYHVVHFNAVNNAQYLSSDNADSLMFDEVIFNGKDGRMYGVNGTAFCKFAEFKGLGLVNQTANANVNVYVFDTLLFNSVGTINGNDTVRNYVEFDSIGNITGSGLYRNAYFFNDGNIIGDNRFDTLTFNPPYTYRLGSSDEQVITDQFNIVGNNCEFIKLMATGAEQANVYKETGAVYGDFIEMTKITASGGALFDAGRFSVDVNNSNVGWVFYDPALNYTLGPDTSFLEGEVIYLCASNFNGNSTTTYEWTNCGTGEFLSADSCIAIDETGNYCLTVFYDEGPGCIKQDAIHAGCHLGLQVDTTHASCNGFNNGAIELQIETGMEPIEVSWFLNGSLYGNTLNIYDLNAGDYYYTMEDAEGCTSDDTIQIKEPMPMALEFTVKESCFESNNGSITLAVTGGTQPYTYSWSNGNSLPEQSNLPPANYVISISDFNACPSIVETITVIELEKVDFQLDGSDLLCYQDGSGSIEMLNLTGGTGNYTTVEWLKDGTYYTDEFNLDTLQIGNYSVTVIDDIGCFGTSGLVISEPPPITIEMTGTNGITNFGYIDVTTSGGTSPYSFLWNTGAITEDVDPLGGGIYLIEVTDDNLCKATDSIFIEVHYQVYAPTAFSPNGDEDNPVFEIRGIGTDLREYDLRIYNRYGQQVFHTTDPKVHWNGKLNNTGPELPVEVYTWVVDLSYFGGTSVVDMGNVSLLR